MLPVAAEFGPNWGIPKPLNATWRHNPGVFLLARSWEVVIKAVDWQWKFHPSNLSTKGHVPSGKIVLNWGHQRLVHALCPLNITLLCVI